MKRAISIVCLTTSVAADDERQTSVIDSLRSTAEEERDLQMLFLSNSSLGPVGTYPPTAVHNRPILSNTNIPSNTSTNSLGSSTPQSQPRYQVINANSPPRPRYTILPSASSSNSLSTPSMTVPSVLPNSLPASFQRANRVSLIANQNFSRPPTTTFTRGSAVRSNSNEELATISNLINRDEEVKALKLQVERLSSALLAIAESMNNLSNERSNTLGTSSATETDSTGSTPASSMDTLSSSKIRDLLTSLLNQTETPHSTSTRSQPKQLLDLVKEMLGIKPNSQRSGIVNASPSELEYDIPSPETPLQTTREVVVPSSGQEIVNVPIASPNMFNSEGHMRGGVLQLVPIQEEGGIAN
eukprot:GDKJ01016017.1.p1 GENE.GDKJ01016017.1~~GDKJ01016017.1.p1  ORF type:complete len:357 (+),score=49.96 GDKJ01016017.1:140-1210(+)